MAGRGTTFFLSCSSSTCLLLLARSESCYFFHLKRKICADDEVVLIDPRGPRRYSRVSVKSKEQSWRGSFPRILRLARPVWSDLGVLDEGGVPRESVYNISICFSRPEHQTRSCRFFGAPLAREFHSLVQIIDVGVRNIQGIHFFRWFRFGVGVKSYGLVDFRPSFSLFRLCNANHRVCWS